MGSHFLPQGIFLPREWTQVSCISCTGRQILYYWATRGAWWLIYFPDNDWSSSFTCMCSEYSQQPWPFLYPLCLQSVTFLIGFEMINSQGHAYHTNYYKYSKLGKGRESKYGRLRSRNSYCERLSNVLQFGVCQLAFPGKDKWDDHLVSHSKPWTNCHRAAVSFLSAVNCPGNSWNRPPPEMS